MSAIEQIRVLSSNLRKQDFPMPTREDLLCALESIERAIVGQPVSERRRSVLLEALMLVVEWGGTTPMKLGNALDPSKEGYHAGALGTARLSAMKQAGLVRKEHFGWWVATEEGVAEVGKIKAPPLPGAGLGLAKDGD